MTIKIALFLVSSLVAWLPSATADVIEFKSGQILTGKYAGGTAATIRFEMASGVQVFETGQIIALTLTTSGTTPAADVLPPPATAPASSPSPEPTAKAARPITIPAGTRLLVRMGDGVSSNSPKGKRFTTTLEVDLVSGGVLVAKAGSKVYGRLESVQSAGRYAGASSVDLRLTELAVGGSLIPIRTGPYAQAGARSMGKTVKGAAAGAVIGAIAGDEAGKGAAIGAVASGIKRGESVTVPPGTLLEFPLELPVYVSVIR